MDKRRKIEILESKIFRLRVELEEVRATLAIPEPENNGTVVRYTRTFGGTKYTYAAVRVRSGRGWYTTGMENCVKTWEEITTEADYGSLMVGSMWTLMVPEETDYSEWGPTSAV